MYPRVMATVTIQCLFNPSGWAANMWPESRYLLFCFYCFCLFEFILLNSFLFIYLVFKFSFMCQVQLNLEFCLFFNKEQMDKNICIILVINLFKFEFHFRFTFIHLLDALIQRNTMHKCCKADLRLPNADQNYDIFIFYIMEERLKQKRNRKY